MPNALSIPRRRLSRSLNAAARSITSLRTMWRIGGSKITLDTLARRARRTECTHKKSVEDAAALVFRRPGCRRVRPRRSRSYSKGHSKRPSPGGLHGGQWCFRSGRRCCGRCRRSEERARWGRGTFSCAAMLIEGAAADVLR